MRVWEVAKAAMTCGRCSERVPAGFAVQFIDTGGARRLVRCELCAEGEPPELLPVAGNVPFTPKPRPMPPASVLPFARVRELVGAFDPKMAAAGRDD